MTHDVKSKRNRKHPSSDNYICQVAIIMILYGIFGQHYHGGDLLKFVLMIPVNYIADLPSFIMCSIRICDYSY